MDFDPAFLPGNGATTFDVDRYSQGNPVLPGHYDVDIRMNGEWQARRTVRFIARDPKAEALPCISRAALEAFGLAADPSPAAIDDPCAPLSGRIPHASATLDVGEQRLDIEVPQAAMARRQRLMAPPDQWQHGITAGLMSWRANIHGASSNGRASRAIFFSHDTGLNLGAWRVRHAGAWSGARYRRRHSFAERPVDRWRSQLRLGDIPLNGDFFDPLVLRGVALASDIRMHPDALDGYGPVVRGVATGHARVRVTQNGIVLRELSVTPGPFVIDDLTTAGSGDLIVDIEESDGRHAQFRVPHFAMPERLREGMSTYAIGIGRLAGVGRERPLLAQMGWRRGLPHDWTVHAGLRRVGVDTSVLGGAALDTLIGAFAADVTHTDDRAARRGGRLWRLRYGRRWRDGTMVSVSFSQGRARALFTGRREPGRSIGVAAQRRVDIAMQRSLRGEGGALALGWSRTWSARPGDAGIDQSLTWSRGWGYGTLDLSLRCARRSLVAGGPLVPDVSVQLGMSLPLGYAPAPVSLHTALRRERDGGGARIGVAGVSGDNGALGYAASMGGDVGRGKRLDASIARGFGGGEVSATVDRSATTRSVSVSASGAVVVHAGGVSVAPYLGDAIALVRARDASGARVPSSATARVDRRGYAVVPQLAPYRWNAVDIDPTGLPLEVSLSATHARVAPRAGAVVLVPFETRTTPTALLTARGSDGMALPFGAEILDREGQSLGLVGQAGRAFMRWDATRPHVTIRWSQGGNGRQCELRLRETGFAAGLRRLEGDCE